MLSEIQWLYNPECSDKQESYRRNQSQIPDTAANYRGLSGTVLWACIVITRSCDHISIERKNNNLQGRLRLTFCSLRNAVFLLYTHIRSRKTSLYYKYCRKNVRLIVICDAIQKKEITVTGFSNGVRAVLFSLQLKQQWIQKSMYTFRSLILKSVWKCKIYTWISKKRIHKITLTISRLNQGNIYRAQLYVTRYCRF